MPPSWVLVCDVALQRTLLHLFVKFKLYTLESQSFERINR